MVKIGTEMCSVCGDVFSYVGEKKWTCPSCEILCSGFGKINTGMVRERRRNTYRTKATKKKQDDVDN